MSLRLSQAQIALAVACALVLLSSSYLGISYLGTQEQKSRLVGQYRALELSLQRLVAAREPEQPGAPDAAESAFPKNPPGIELTDLVIRAARETGAEILGLHASAVGTEQIGSGTYRVVKINLRLRADPWRLAHFFDRVERGATPTMVFDNIEVDSSGEVWEVSLELLAYAQST